MSHFQQACKKQARTDGKNSTNRFDLFLEAKRRKDVPGDSRRLSKRKGRDTVMKEGRGDGREEGDGD